MKPRTRKSLKFSVSIAVITFVLAAIFSIASEAVLSNVIWFIGLFTVFIIVFLGVIFDMMGIAATSAVERPFHAMAAEKITGAKEAVSIIRNADKFASFCNDVIGDISGIISGTAASAVVLQVANLYGQDDGASLQVVLSVVLTSLVAALTVGGKAIAKHIAINSSTDLIFFAGRVIAFIESHFKIKILPRAEKNEKK
ncbi:hypothetical protein GCM10028778_10040 [Barrientosiimonas marina]|uniref:CNNM transmembrane domain-containing protein n=1 Tax=Lentibacillus kimchii TaxID=1542911 RepID=A0ABW2V1I9_9BACI